MSNTYTLGFNTIDSFGGKITDRTDTENCHIGTFTKLACSPYLNGFKGALPINNLTSTSRIANSKRSHIRQLRRIHKAPQLMFIIRCSNGDIRYGTQKGQIERSMMCRAILPHKSTTINTEYYIRARDSNIVDDIVISTLQKR